MTPDLVLCAMDDAMAQAWETVAAGRDAVRVHRGSLLGLEVDAVVSPANSQGFMRGGIDAAYAAAFPGVEDRVRSAIRDGHGGILPVGTALAVPTGVPRPAWLVSAPTMELPGELLGEDTDHPYRAAHAVLSWWRETTLPDGGTVRDRVASIAMPGLGTGVGGVPPEVCARQVARAWDEVFGT